MSRTSTAIPAPADLIAAGRRELAGLAQLLASAQPGDSVHGARRRIKQLRSLLRLLRPALDDETWQGCNAALREAADALAGHRRAEALVTAAGKLHPASDAGFWLSRAAAYRAAHAAEGDPVAALAAARAAIGRAAYLLGKADGRGDGAAVADTFLATYAKARKRLRAGLRSEVPDELHEARKFVIHHLHHLRLLYPDQAHRLEALESLREVLGDLNDLEELAQLSGQAAAPAAEARRMRKARLRLMARTGQATDRLFRHKAKRFARRLGHAAKPRSRRGPVALETGE